jgi:cation diffusion facilitator family transporter
MSISIDNTERYETSRRVTVISMAVNASLTAAQILIGWLGHSAALIADGVHTLSDLVADAMVLFAVKHGAKDADEEHPYGHARIETAVTVLLSLVLVAVGVGIAVNAGIRLSNPNAFVQPSALTLFVALITLLAKEGLYRYTVFVARRLKSNLLHASAWHHRSDAFSSIVVALGIAGSLAGLRYLDALAAIGVALMIANMGLGLGWKAVRELIDTGLEAEQVARIREAIVAVCGVKTLHLLRTRQTGGRALVDVHILVDGTLSVSEGHHIGEAVRAKLMAEIDGIADVMVHIDPEDDETAAPNAGLPLRDVVLARFQGYFVGIDAARHIEDVALHYLDGRLHVELLLPLCLLGDRLDAAALRDQFHAALAHDPHVGSLELRFR